jgi:threonine/homoserine/homoserine lactone efflux protein
VFVYGAGCVGRGAGAAVGLGALVAASTTAFTVLKLVGAAYVVYLGIQAIRHRGDARAALEQDGGARRTSGVAAVRAGFVVGVTNPKTIVFLMAFLPQFIAAGAPAVPQLLLLGVLFAVLACASDIVWVLAASRARTWFARRPERLDGLGLTGGVMMIGVGGFLATSHNA